MTKRKLALACARMCGYHNDSATFTRLRIEARVKYKYLEKEWFTGVKMKENGVPCTCRECNPV
jgi:hypothetical protein